MYSLISTDPTNINFHDCFTTIIKAQEVAGKLRQLGFCHKYTIETISYGKPIVVYESEKTLSI